MNCTGYPSWYDDIFGDDYFECPYNHECNGCEYDCRDDDHD